MEVNILKLLIISLTSLCVLSGPIVDRFEAVDPALRVDCAPDPNVDENTCKSRGCTWSPVSIEVGPFK
jgi:hypothetical protein